nr:uncharacterized protein LOC117995716 [Maniola hyperantus]
MTQIPDSSKEIRVKILGLDWDLKEDLLQLRYKIDSNANNKREVLRVIASIYDPCGFVAPHILPAKLFLQELWKTKIKWDTTFSKQMKEEWSTIREQLDKIKEISIPRCYMANAQNNDVQLHCFTDASLKAYAATVYIVNENKISFVIGKSRLVPIKDQDNLKIPRLELLGVLIGSRLIKFIRNFLSAKVTHKFLWTDSQIVIGWCKSSKLLPPFVARRIQEIKRNKELIIRYVPLELNAADVATKPYSTCEEKAK